MALPKTLPETLPSTLLLAAVLALGLALPDARAQTPLPVPAQGGTAATSEEQIREQIAREGVDRTLSVLTDGQAREMLAARLRAEADESRAARRTAHGGFGVALVTLRKRIEQLGVDIGVHLRTLQAGAAALPVAVPAALEKLAGPLGPARLTLETAALIALGLVAYVLARRRLASVRAALEADTGAGLLGRIGRAGGRLLVDLLPVLVFAAITLAIAMVRFADDGAARNVAVAYVSGMVVVLLAKAGSVFVLAPHAPAIRIAPMSDAAARFAHRWLVALTAAGSLLWLTAGLVIMTGMPLSQHLAIVVATGGALALTALVMIWQCRGAVGEWLAAGPGDGAADDEGAETLTAQLARRWHVGAIGYALVVYALWSYQMLARNPTAVWAALGSVAFVVALPLLDRAAARALRAAFGVGDDAMLAAAQLEPPPEPPQEILITDSSGPGEGGEPETDAMQAEGETLSEREQTRLAALERRRGYVRVARASVRLVVGVVATIAVLQLWGLNVLSVAGPGAEAAFWRGIVGVVTAIVIATLLWELVKALVDPHMPEPVDASHAGDEDHNAPRTRAETLLPLLRMTLLILIVVFTTMTCLSSIGLDIGPLLAGAGVVGLAIGFGAQTLVRDIVSGIFFLIDDAFRVGEYIEFGDIRGEVEAITLRSVRLRHHRGAIHTVPFGELRSVTNYNRDWVIYKMEFRLPIDTDMEKVRKIIKRIGQGLMDDPEHGQNLIQPLKSQGIHRLEETAIILRTKFMCKPREQFVLRRVAYQRIQQAFADAGIQLAPRTVRVAGASGEQTEETRPAAAAVAVEHQSAAS